GEPARRQLTTNPRGTTTGFKRMMGTRETITLHDQRFSPEQLSAFLLQKIKADAEAFLGESVQQAVVTVPAYFDDNQRTATKDACRIAGLEALRLVNEPTAASLAYGLDRAGDDLRIAVIDLGGGTLDVTILEFGKGVFEVKATSGDTKLGGVDMDRQLVDYLAKRFRQEHGVDVREDPQASARLREAAEIAKVELSTAATTRINLPFLIAVDAQPLHLDVELTRAELERQVHDTIERCRGPVEQALHDAGRTPKEVDRLVFVGGPTRMPAVRRFFEDLFGRKAELGVDPMECVASGAAIQAGVLSGEVSDIVLVDVTPLTLGVETLGGVATPLIARNSPVPVKHTETFTTAADMQTSVTVHVYQGERPMAQDNTSLGQFNLDGLPPAPRGVPKIEVTFDIDTNGILSATAADLGTGKSRSLRITDSTRLPDDEKQRMIADAEKYAEADKKRRDEVEKLNDADSVCYQAEQLLADHGDKLSEDLRRRVDEGRKKTRQAHASKDASAASSSAETLRSVLREAGASIYARVSGSGVHPHPETPSSGAAEARPTGSGPSGRVVDAEYREAR
ncbi:MAG: molecular chaperone DnaK, partial [Myxococcales bacterium]|nr:molecular chaperone DnaK [Myxococcales bacterium]